MAYPGMRYSFEAQGHKEDYTVTNDSAQVIFITDGMELVDPVLHSELEPAQPGSTAASTVPAGGGSAEETATYRPGTVVKPPRLEEFKMNMLLQTVGLMSSCYYAMLRY